MSITHTNKLPVEIGVSLNTLPLSILILGLFEFFLVHILKRINSFFATSYSSSIQSESKKLKVEYLPNKQSFLKEKAADESMSRGEMEFVLTSIGFSCCPDEGNLPARFDSNDISNMFEQKNPGLDEVKEAFDVFDGKRDGFIDAEELQVVLCGLGYSEGSDMEKCRRMIRVFDENGDGRIDFQEFVKFMQDSFC